MYARIVPFRERFSPGTLYEDMGRQIMIKVQFAYYCIPEGSYIIFF